MDSLPTFSLVVVCIHAVQDWKSLIKLCVRPGHGTSSNHWNIWRLENGGKWSIIDGLAPTMVCVGRENSGQLEFPRRTRWRTSGFWRKDCSCSGALKGPRGGQLQPITNYRIKHVCKPILQAKWSNKQKTKVLCIKVHFVHFYPSIIFKIQMCPTLNKGGVLCMGATEEDSFSFQPIEGPKVPCFYSF